MQCQNKKAQIDEMLYSKVVYDQESDNFEISNAEKFFVMQSGLGQKDSFLLMEFFREAMLRDEDSGRFIDNKYNDWVERVFFKGGCTSMYRGELTAALSNYFGQMILKRRADLESLKAAHSTKPEGSIVAEVSRNRIAIVEEAIEFYERLHKDWCQRKSELAPEQLDWESKQRVWETLKK
jgi:hypothetical protein